MALETISQILSSTNATYINGVSAQRLFSPAVLANLYQGLVEKDGRGVNDTFVSSKEAEEAAQIFVNRILPVRMKPREMGASRNGGSFSANQHYTQTITVGIEILQVLDDPIIIPRARQDMIKVDLLAEQTKIYSDRLRTILNGATAASKLLASWTADAANLVVFNPANDILTQFIEANSLLDEGDQDNGIDIFPEDTRVAVFKPSYRATLKAGKGVLNLGGANYAYDIAKAAGISTEAAVAKVEDGYIGDIDGVPCHIISNESLAHAAEFLGLPTYEFSKGLFVGYIASSYANARGVSTTEQTKIVDAQSGQGLVLQPYTKFGVVSWYPKGNVILSSATYNPLAWLKGKFNDVVIKLKGAGSRLYPTIPAAGVVLTSNTAFTLSGATALDDFNVSHLEGGYYVVADHEITTLADFITACATGENGAYTLGQSKSFTTSLTDGQWCNVLVVADDGSVVITGVKYEA